MVAQQANPFGQPFLFQIEDDETLDQVKPRIQVSRNPTDYSMAVASCNIYKHIGTRLEAVHRMFMT